MAPEYLPPVLSKQPDSRTRELGQKSCLRRYPLDYTCGTGRLNSRRSVDAQPKQVATVYNVIPVGRSRFNTDQVSAC